MSAKTRSICLTPHKLKVKPPQLLPALPTAKSFTCGKSIWWFLTTSCYYNEDTSIAVSVILSGSVFLFPDNHFLSVQVIASLISANFFVFFIFCSLTKIPSNFLYKTFDLTVLFSWYRSSCRFRSNGDLSASYLCWSMPGWFIFVRSLCWSLLFPDNLSGLLMHSLSPADSYLTEHIFPIPEGHLQVWYNCLRCFCISFL